MRPEHRGASDEACPRHWLVRLLPAARDRVLRAPQLDCEAQQALSTWAKHAWPLVVRRPLDADEGRPGVVPVGVALPPALGKRRVPFTVDLADVHHVLPPLSLGEALDRLPNAWRHPLATLDRAAGACGVYFQVFGSVAWQALTGFAYLHDASDVDLLMRPRDYSDLAAAMALLEQWERRSGRRADGEILFAGDAAVSWREWRAAQRQHSHVLVKTRTSAYLAPCDALVPNGWPDVVEDCA